MSGNSMYIGPRIPSLGLKARLLVVGLDPPPQLLSLIQTKPLVRSLFVPTDQVSEAIRKMMTRGSLENQAVKVILEFNKAQPK